MSRIVILTEGKSNPTDAKTATGILRYRLDEVVAVLDSTQVGKTAGQVLGVGGSVPFVASLAGVDADTLLIGIAPAGGGLPVSWRSLLRQAIERRMEIVSGLHFFIGDDPEFRELASKYRVRIYDVRKPPPGISVSRNIARSARCFRVHTVGHDCSVGKMVTGLELARELCRRGRDAEFLATGQTGIMIAGKGLPIDAVVSDFVAGATEKLVLDAQHREIVVVEGQGTLVHPLYSGVTLGLLHGCAPQAMVMCYDPLRREIKYGNMPIPPLGELIDLYERVASYIAPSEVVGVAANTAALSAAEAEAELRRVQAEVGLPATDVVRFGCGPLADAVLAARERLRESAGRSGAGAAAS
jgi:uncharacterized NAD-dependent epimerase/dehydratase family protein